jgi:hypothetical protein
LQNLQRGRPAGKWIPGRPSLFLVIVRHSAFVWRV